jgi:hypothetical protein
MDFFRIIGANRARTVSTTTVPADAVVVSRDMPIEAFS